MLRIISLCLVILLSIGIIVPFANSAHGVRQNTQVGKSMNRRHSKAWWRRYRARMRKKRAAALAHRNMLLALPKNLPVGELASITVPVEVGQTTTATTEGAANAINPKQLTATVPVTNVAPVANVLPVPNVAPATRTLPVTNVLPVPNTVPVAKMSPVNNVLPVPNAVPVTNVSRLANVFPVNNAPAASNVTSAHPVSKVTSTLPVLSVTNAQPVASATSPAALKPKTKNSVAPLPGQMNLAVVAMSRPNPAFLTSREEAKMLAGMNIADLRRIVIDKMVVAGGWVTNDFVREVSGGRVFVVTARTPKDGRSPEKAWTFYFTEVAGRIYGLSTDSAVEYSDRMSTEAERLITNLRSNPQAIKK
jgi:hypothetical protein